MSYKSQLEEFTSFANLLADESAKITLNFFRQTFVTENKNDNTPVTIADKNVELKIRDLINKNYPKHGVLGEEFENINPNSE